MARTNVTTTQRGYGYAHQQERAQRLAQWRPGDTCARCGGLLDGDPAHMDLGHLDGTGKTMYAGLEHKRCNRSAGQRLTAQLLRQRRHGAWLRPQQPPWTPSREW